MEKFPDQEDTGRRIVGIFVQYFKYEAGDVLGERDLRTVWFERGHDSRDLRPGMDYAMERGWVEKTDDAASYRLTDQGEAVAQQGSSPKQQFNH